MGNAEMIDGLLKLLIKETLVVTQFFFVTNQPSRKHGETRVEKLAYNQLNEKFQIKSSTS